MKISLLFQILVIVFWSSSILATRSVRLPDSELPDVSVTTTSTFSVEVDGVTSQPTSLGSPAGFYIPIRTVANGSGDRHILKLGATGLPTTTSGFISTSLELTNDEGNRELFVASRRSSDTTFRVVAKHTSTITTSATVTMSFNISSLCAAVDNADLDCIGLENLAGGKATESDNLIYYFLYDEVANGVLTPTVSEIDPADARFADGIFFDGNFSNKTDVVEVITVALSPITRGDASLKLTYVGSGSITNFDQVIVFQHAGTSSSGTIGAASGSILSEGTFPALLAGDITVNGLTNGTTVTLSVAFADKFGFSTNLSNPESQTPIEIQVFLEEENCYLLSSGFQEKHYVIDYFKHIRDDYLLKSSLGKSFVEFYYATAPSYTHYIYKNPSISKLVRGAGYAAYFVFNYFIFIALAMAVLIAVIYRQYVSIKQPEVL